MAYGETTLQGLRGLSALHLLLYHSLSRTKWPQDWLVDIQVDTLTKKQIEFVQKKHLFGGS